MQDDNAPKIGTSEPFTLENIHDAVRTLEEANPEQPAPVPARVDGWEKAVENAKAGIEGGDREKAIRGLLDAATKGGILNASCAHCQSSMNVPTPKGWSKGKVIRMRCSACGQAFETNKGTAVRFEPGPLTEGGNVRTLNRRERRSGATKHRHDRNMERAKGRAHGKKPVELGSAEIRVRDDGKVVVREVRPIDDGDGPEGRVITIGMKRLGLARLRRA